MDEMMKKLLDYVIEHQPEQKLKEPNAVACQITFKTGSGASGVLSKGPVEGTYRMVAVIADGRGRPCGAIDLYFLPETVGHVGLIQDLEQNRIEIAGPVGAPSNIRTH